MGKSWKQVIAKHRGSRKTLLSKDGPTSDGFQEKDDDDSSSLSGRQDEPRFVSKKSFAALKLFRRKKNITGDDDGYESDASAESIRSTSSSFLRYQNRARWKAKLTGKSVVQRRENGAEVPIEDAASKPWPIFDRIYKRQNQILKNGEAGEDGKDGSSDEEDNDSDFSTEGVTGNGAPLPMEVVPDTIFRNNSLEEEVQELLEINADTKLWEKMSDGTGVATLDEVVLENVVSRESPITTQESGISTCERDPAEKRRSNVPEDLANIPHLFQSLSKSLKGSPTEGSYNVSAFHDLPRTHLPTFSDYVEEVVEHTVDPSPVESSEENIPKSANKPKKSNASKALAPKKTGDILTPLSIPRTICYSLRSAIGDGSARQRNNHSLMERRALRPNGSHIDTSHWSHRGKRSYMEDRFVIEHLGSTNQTTPITWLAVFDGHGGSAASQFCSDWLSSYVRKNEYYPHELPLAMKTACTKLDSDFVSSGYLDGSTACACAIVGFEKVICCNAGDSRAIIVKRDGSAIPLSEDHKPGRNDETKRINDLGGRVIYWGRWRVEGVLAVSRSVGDAKLKPFVTAEPDIVEHDIGEDDMFLVVASDGIWDTMTSDLVAKFVLVNTCKIVNKSLQVDNTLLRWIARQISKRARENGSTDNVSCIVANLKSRQHM